MANLSTTPITAYGFQAYALAGTRSQGQGKVAPFDPTSPLPAGAQSEDQISLSKKGKDLSSRPESPEISEQNDKTAADTRQTGTKGSDQQLLDEAELRQVQQLQQRDAEVRTHEQAHLSTAGQYASGGPSFSYQTGPNGKRYAVGGSVPIDIGKEATPAATIMKMRTVKRAALAPASPSAADRQIAAKASMQEMQAIQELQTTQLTEKQDAPSIPIGKSNNESPENLPKNNTKIAPDSAPDTKAPSHTTRAIMSAAYRAMASLA